ncbi:MAG: glucose-1-phosphate adenylyltransferase [Clostridia bacterium]|nr:glucose-1-phosphate adenylyltransferase [Clostridia bacterium]
MAKKNIVAMILAGGQGSRLGLMTKKMAKPAVPFGGKYRIIDFALSNCSNSGIDTVGILTQYKPQVLNSHIGIGTPWDLDRVHGGVAMLPPYMTEAGGDWYKGTANAVYQNMSFLDEYNPDYVLMLSGDHIYKMDYRVMLREHKKNKADATIAVIDVPLEEASRFGIMSTDENMQITEFEEKPKQPKSTLASMGIYIFSYPKLRQYLIEDAQNHESSNDFGKNIIPNMLKNGERLFAYRFEGYWKDVGTIESYWETSMDLLDPDNDAKLYDDSWKIFTDTASRPAQHISAGAVLENSIISEGCIVDGTVINSIIFPDVTIGKNTRIENSIIMSGCKICNNVIVSKSILLENITVMDHTVIGNGKDIALIDGGRVIETQGRMD